MLALLWDDVDITTKV